MSVAFLSFGVAKPYGPRLLAINPLIVFLNTIACFRTAHALHVVQSNHVGASWMAWRPHHIHAASSSSRHMQPSLAMHTGSCCMLATQTGFISSSRYIDRTPQQNAADHGKGSLRPGSVLRRSNAGMLAVSARKLLRDCNAESFDVCQAGPVKWSERDHDEVSKVVMCCAQPPLS